MQYLDNDLSANQHYLYTNISYNHEGIRSDPSAVVVQTLDGPNAPDSDFAIEYGQNLLELFRAKTEGAEGDFGYVVYRDGVLLLNTRGQSYLEQQVEPSVTYRYPVVSVAANSRTEPTPALEIKLSDDEYWVSR